LLAFRCRLVCGDALAGTATLGCGFQGVSSSLKWRGPKGVASAALSVMTVLNSGSFFKDSAGTLFRQYIDYAFPSPIQDFLCVFAVTVPLRIAVELSFRRGKVRKTHAGGRSSGSSAASLSFNRQGAR
jgi:hypothetical protein